MRSKVRAKSYMLMQSRGRSCLGQSREAPSCLSNAPEARIGPSSNCQTSCAPTPAPSRSHVPQSSCASREGPSTPPSIPTRTRNLAKSMNADIVQAEPLQRGPVDNLIIPPGAINSDRTTIVSIPQPEGCAPLISSTPGPCQPNESPNRSIQALNDTLDEQVYRLPILF
jgi:hypothetical protein